MQGRQASVPGNLGRHQGERFFLQRLHGLSHRGVVVQHVLRPGGDAQSGLSAFGRWVFRLHQPQQVGDQTGLVDPVGGGDVITRSNHAPITRSPLDRTCAHFAITLHTLGKDPQVGRYIGFPVHGARGDHRLVIPQVGQSRAGLGHRQTQHESCQAKG